MARLQVDLQIPHYRKRFQRSHGVWKSRRNSFNGQRIVEVIGEKSRGSRDCFAFVLNSEGRIDLRHLAERRLPGESSKAHRHFADIEFEHDLRCAA